MDICLENNQAGFNAVHVACKTGQKAVLEFMINKGLTQLDDKDEILQNTPLHHAIKNGNINIVRFLLTPVRLVELSICNRDGLSPLHLACKLGFTEIVRCLVEEAKADIKQKAVGQSG